MRPLRLTALVLAMAAGCQHDDPMAGPDGGAVDADGDAGANDAEIDAPPGPTTTLLVTYQQTVMSSDGSEAPLAYPALPAGTTVMAGPVDGALVVARDVGDGAYTFPDVAAGTVVHAVITSAAMAPTEVVWTQGAAAAHVVVPLIGRQSVAPPTGSGWTVTFSGGPTTFPRTLGLSTGAWTEGRKGATGPAPFAYELAQLAAPLGGVLAAPDATQGDHGVLLAMPLLPAPGSATCVRTTTGAVTFDPPTLQQGHLSAVGTTPAWDADTTKLQVSWPRDPLRGRFNTQLGLLAGDESGRLAFGYMPSHAIPAFTRAGELDDRGVARPLPVPPMLTVLECPLDRDLSDGFAPVDVLEASAQPTAHVQVRSTRSFTSQSGQALSLVSAFDIVSGTTGTGTATHAASFALTAPMPRAIKLTQGARVSDLMVDLDGAAFSGSEPFTLTFAAHDENNEVSDYWSVTLVKITAGTKTPIRTVLTTALTATFPTTLFETGAEYYFELRAHAGYPDAAAGDYTLATFPQSMTTVSTRTFRRG